MPQLKIEERIFIVEKYIESKSINHVRQQFSLRIARLPVRGTSKLPWQNIATLIQVRTEIKETLEEVNLL